MIEAPRTQAEPCFAFNGIDATTGEYLLPPISLMEAYSLLGMGPMEAIPRGPGFGVDVCDLGATGWGVIFPEHGDPAIREALEPLLQRREEQAGKVREGLFRVLSGADGYRPGESMDDFLSRHGAGPGPVQPERMPYYLLLVGGPEEIPFEFQLQLDVQHAVGRIHFQTLEEYVRYASSVVLAETCAERRARRIALWGPANSDDPATALSSKWLVGGLERALSALIRVGNSCDGWRLDTSVAAAATKERLSALLGPEDPPALLFTASHGMGFPSGHALQARQQGALLCQDWPGPREWQGPVPPEQYFSADDVGEGHQPAGLVSFHFACFSGGTPAEDDFAHLRGHVRKKLAPQPFVAGLPQRLAAHPGGGALAVIAHVERAWGYSFAWRDLDCQLGSFTSAFHALMAGQPVGAAMEYFGMRYAELAVRLQLLLQKKERGRTFDPEEVMMLWTANNDAKSYAIFGDPAVRPPVA